MRPNTLHSILARTAKNGDCLEWQGRGINKTRDDQLDYGLVSIKSHEQLAHRVVYELAVGPIPEGLCVLHKCDNPRCVNIEHLFIGTTLDNIKDMVAKGRQRGVSRPGETNPSAKLTWTQVDSIRSEYKRRVRGATLLALAQKYHVGETTIRRVVTGFCWRDEL
jgi:hypothetical protein